MTRTLTEGVGENWMWRTGVRGPGVVKFAYDFGGMWAGGRRGVGVVKFALAIDAPDLPRKTIHHSLMAGQSRGVTAATVQNTGLIGKDDLSFSGGMILETTDTDSVLTSMRTLGDSFLHIVAVQQFKAMILDAGEEYTVLASSHAVSGQPISNLDPGSTAYTNGLWQMEEGARLAGEVARPYAIPHIYWIQGEADWNNANYKSDLRALLDQYQEDALAAGSTSTPILICDQLDSEQYFAPNGDPYEPKVAGALLELSEEYDDFVLAGPTYPVPHSDGVHMNMDSMFLHGQMLGKATYYAHHGGWTPLKPISIEATAPDSVLATFHVPFGVLTFDTTTVDDPGDYGFEVIDDDGAVGITSVSLEDEDKVRIDLDRPLSTNPELLYAWSAVGGQLGGPTTGPRGNLRDTDDRTGFKGGPLYDWCVRFRKPVA